MVRMVLLIRMREKPACRVQNYKQNNKARDYYSGSYGFVKNESQIPAVGQGQGQTTQNPRPIAPVGQQVVPEGEYRTMPDLPDLDD